MVTVTKRFKEKLENKEVARVYGTIIGSQGDDVNASDLDVKSILVANVVSGTVGTHGGAYVTDPGSVGNKLTLSGSVEGATHTGKWSFQVLGR